MKNKALDLDLYDFTRAEILLFDANVWLYLYPAPSARPPHFARQYSEALKRMLNSGVLLAIDALVLSEYVNRYCRIQWRALHQDVYPEFNKDFRRSAEFAAISKNAGFFAREMLRLCFRPDYPFASVDIAQVLADFESGANDLNDGLLTETCRHNGWKFVTNDGDFTTGGIEVLTTNPKLIAACP